MSLMKTLAKVAIGVAVAKGVSGMMKKGGQSSGSGGGLLGGLGDALKGGQPQGGGAGGMGDLLGQVLGGAKGNVAPQGGGQSGGLGGLLESLGQRGAPQGQSGGGGLGDLIGGLTKGGGQGGAGGSLGDLLGQLAGGAGGAAAGQGGALGELLGSLAGKAPQGQGKAGGSFGQILDQAFQKQGEPEIEPTLEQEAVAGLMLRAMIQSAKCDGQLDAGEREKLMSHLGDISPEEKRFVDAELEGPVDVAGLAAQVPPGLEQQVYAMSLMAIDLDSQAEAQYLHSLAQNLRLQQQEVNVIHQKLGAPQLYS